MTLAQLPISDSLLKQLISMGTVGIILTMVLIGAVIFLAINRRERAGDKEANENTSALIKVVGDLSKAINSLKDDRDLDMLSRDRLAAALEGVTSALTSQEKVTSDYQKLIDDSLALMQESVEGLNKDANRRINIIHEDVQQVIRLVEALPGQYEELKKYLDDILQALEAKEAGNHVNESP